MNTKSVQLLENKLTAEDFIRLKVATGFAERPLLQVQKALENGLYNVSAVCDGMVVGMGRLVGDGALYWYLQEIVVLPDYQGMGIGRQIVSHLLEYIRNNAIHGTQICIGLTSVAGKEPFYEKFGFVRKATGMAQWLQIE